MNPVKRSNIYEKWDITNYPSYQVYLTLLKLQASATKYVTMRIYGNDLIIRLQNFIFNKRYLKPALDTYSVAEQLVFDLKNSVLLDNNFENQTAEKCAKCSYLYLCGRNYLSKHATCPPCRKIIQAVGERLKA